MAATSIRLFKNIRFSARSPHPIYAASIRHKNQEWKPFTIDWIYLISNFIKQVLFSHFDIYIYDMLGWPRVLRRRY